MKCIVFLALLAICYAAPMEQANGLECEGCQVLGNYLEGKLKDPTFQQQIVAAVTKLCQSLPGQVGQDCLQGITQNQAQVFSALENVVDPNNLCPKIGLCSSNALERMVDTLRKHLKAGMECEACEWAVGKVESMLTSSSILPNLLKQLQAVCNALPSNIQSSCNQIITQYGQQVIQDITNLLNPQTACTEMKVCSSSNSKKTAAAVFNAVFKAPQPNDFGCDACKAVFAEIDSQLQSNEQTGIAIIKQLCYMLPSSYQQSCTDLVANYGQQGLDYVIAQLEPTLICGEIHACSSTMSKPFNIPFRQAATKDTCDTCKVLAQKVDDALTADQDQILAAADGLCAQLGLLGNACKNLINQYGPAVLNVLIQKLQPVTVCAAIKAC